MKIREEIIELLPKNSVGAEIGVFKGEFGKFIFNTVTPKKLYLVDIFTGVMCSGDKNGDNMEYINLDESYNNLKIFFKNDLNVELFRGYSRDFFLQIPDDHLDFVYIDGDHSYEGVKIDLDYAFKKVKAGGIIAGHDYTPRFEGIIRAVNEFCDTHGVTKIITESDGCPSYYIVNTKQ